MERRITRSEIYKVEFFEPVGGKTEYFYGSLKAIFVEHDKETVGCTLDTLYGARISAEQPKVTNKCIIKRVPVARLQKMA